jgi:hypothetical protein
MRRHFSKRIWSWNPLPHPHEPPYVPTVLPTAGPMDYRLDGLFPSRSAAGERRGVPWRDLQSRKGSADTSPAPAPSASGSDMYQRFRQSTGKTPLEWSPVSKRVRRQFCCPQTERVSIGYVSTIETVSSQQPGGEVSSLKKDSKTLLLPPHSASC